MSTISGGLGLYGVTSGIDTQAIIQHLMDINGVPLMQLNSQKSVITNKQSAMTDLSNRMQQLEDLANKLQDTSGLLTSTADESDVSILSASPGTGAAIGSHTITVGALATYAQQVQSGVSAADTKVGAGAFSYIYKAGQTDQTVRTVYATADTTLQGLADLINKDAGNPGVSATVLQYDNGAGGVYHLVLSGKDSGSTFAVQVNDPATTLDGSNGTADLRQATFTATQQAQDAKIRVDGYPAAASDPSDKWITRSSNTITDIIPGVNLSLHKIGTTTVTVTHTTGALEQDISNLVSIYNGLVDTVKKDAGYNSTTKTSGPLQGDSVINNMMSLIRNSLVNPTAGFVAGSDSFTMPTDLGISIDKVGHLAVDTTTLESALQKDYDGVLSLIGATAKGKSNDTHIQFSSATKTTAGAYEVQVDFTAGAATAARIRKVGETAWRDATVNGSTVSGKLGNPEQGLALTVVWDGASATQNATVRVQQGFAGDLYARMQTIMDPKTGTMTSDTATYQAQLDQLTDKITKEQTRLNAEQQALKDKFSRLEATLTQLQGFKAAFGSLIDQTSGASSSNSGSSSS
jgi:flagellar hook-associated protein 2